MEDKNANFLNENNGNEQENENKNNISFPKKNKYLYQRKEEEDSQEIYQEGIYDKNNEIEIISEDENEDESKNQNLKVKININNNNLDDYNKIYDEILRKNKDNLIFKKDNNNSFKPLSQMEKRSMKKNNSNNINNSNSKSFQITEKTISKSPIELSLYKEAEKRKEKREKLEYNNMMNIMLNASKVKMSNNSHKIAINKIEKIIDDTVNKYEKDKKITFINVGEILTELKILRQTFPKEENIINNNNNTNNNFNNSNYQSYKDIQLEMINTKENEIRKQKEVNFYEQLWLTLNPGNTKYIKSDILSEILKILLTPMNSNIKEISDILKQFLLTAFFLNSNPDEVKKYISPITEKEITEEEIWPIEKLVKEFLSLKENLLAYQGLKHFNKSMQKEINNSKKELSFKPKINESSLNWNYYSERLPALVEREKLRQQVLEEMKKENEEKDLKECTFKPKINVEKKRRKNSQNNLKSNISIFDKLYLTDKGKYEKLKKLKEEEEKKEEEKELEFCTFKPKLISQNSLKKSLNSTEKPKGFDEYQKKMREGIIKATEKKYMEKNIGQNYEKIKKKNIQPFNITDLKKNNDKKDFKKDEQFFTIQIKIPNGKERHIKVYLNEDPYDVADNFCKTYCLKNEVKERLAKTILNFRNLYLQKNHIQNKKDDSNSICLRFQCF